MVGTSLKKFCQGEQRSQPQDPEEIASGGPEFLVKKQGDFPVSTEFWSNTSSA
jgi:hypothetical protein